MSETREGMKRRRPHRHWYRQYIGGCPVCGADKSYRERVYGTRPKRAALRYIELPEVLTYDHCIG